MPSQAADNFYTPKNEAFYRDFKYLPLDASRQEIRLLRIDGRGKGNHELISNVSLHRAPIYSALSYYSGDQASTAAITVEGLEFNAFANLATAIRQAQRFWQKQFPDRELILWTDQVCINQSDSTERAQQVSFMKEIYRRAEQVIIPLFEAFDTTAKSLGFVHNPLENWLDQNGPEAWLERHFERQGTSEVSRYARNLYRESIRPSLSTSERLRSDFKRHILRDRGRYERSRYDLPVVADLVECAVEGYTFPAMPELFSLNAYYYKNYVALAVASRCLGQILKHPWWSRVW